MLDKYLTNNPIPWLIDGENPAVTYFVKSEILKIDPEPVIYDELLKSILTPFFNNKVSHGILGDSNHLNLFNRGSVWFFLYAVESGFKKSMEFISNTADFICNRTQLSNGGFSYDCSSSDAVGCRTGNMIYSMLKCCISDNRTDAGIDWILKNQRNDGGWMHCPVAGICDVMKLIFLKKTGNGLKYEYDANVKSCPIASYTCLKALSQTDFSQNVNAINNGADFFIKNNFFMKSRDKIICGNRANFQKIGYPVMSQYDFLSGLILISRLTNSNSKIFSESFNEIIKKQNADGTWNLENNLSGMINERVGKSRWATLNAIRLINGISSRDNQFENA